jgi:hypothetical protein
MTRCPTQRKAGLSGRFRWRAMALGHSGATIGRLISGRSNAMNRGRRLALHSQGR